MKKKDTLKKYRQKRDFTKTPEPEGNTEKAEGHRYLIQKHDATRLHYDFRLELDGVLKSWAVTKGPSLDPHDKRLAVEVEDHPVSYGSFEGTIPKGQYGGGTVMLWDEGSWEPIGDPRKGLKEGKLEFILHGERLHGEWTLVRMKPRPNEKYGKGSKNNWLLIKHNDDEAEAGNNDKLLTNNATSVVSERSMEEIAEGGKVWQSNRGNKTKKKPAVKPGAKVKPSKFRLPPFIPPQLATLSDAMPLGEAWVHEVKLDGYRALAYIKDGQVKIYTRSGQDWTHKFQALANSLARLKVHTAVLDGEIVAVDEEGHSSFKSLQYILSEGGEETLHYYVFDLLHLNGVDLRRQTLLGRKAELKKILKSSKGNVFFSEHFEAADDCMLHKVCSMQLEGLISKRTDAPYGSGRGTGWLKSKCHKRQEFIIGGFTEPTHAERGVGALLLGYMKNGEFVYAGKVGTGFDNQTSLSLRRKLDALQQKTMPFGSISAAGRRGAAWVKPKLVCEVEFTECTPDGHLRHPSFQGLREDKPAMAIHREVPKAHPNKKGDAEVRGVRISHSERNLYPGTDITKLDLAEYYAAVAEYILPHVKNRPLSMVRCPEGTSSECFFQRHIAKGQSPYLHDAGINVKGRRESYMMIKDLQGLITLVQWGVIELHPWGCTADKPELPDRIIFDLDPDPAVAWKDVIAGAKEVRDRLAEMGLKSFVKTTGGKGLHVVAPIARKYGWNTIKAFAKAIADSMQADNPKRFIAKSSKEARKGKIFIDYLRNDLTSTAVAAFSARAREGAPVAVTLSWDELKPSLKPLAFTIENVPTMLKRRKKDPWAEFWGLKQAVPSKVLKALGIEMT